MTLTIHNLPTKLHERLHRRAERHGRRLDDEIVACLRKSLSEDREALLDRIRSFRASLTIHPLTETEVEAAINSVRP